MSITPFPTQGQYPWYDQLKNWGADTQTAAENATNVADQAHADAATAQSTADTAVTNAATAQTRADDAFSNADTAQSTADTAVTNAGLAQDRADLGVANAATAQATADAALPVHLPPASGTNLDTLSAVGVHPVPWLAGTLALNFPIASTAGIVEVLPYDGVKLIQRFTPTTGTSATRGTWTRRRTDTSTWGAWVFQPVQRIDNTAGRAIYTWDDTQNQEQLIYGDTGERAVLLHPDILSGTVTIRRRNSTVTASFNTVVLPAGSGLCEIVPSTSVPSGFRPSANRLSGELTLTSNATSYQKISGYGPLSWLYQSSALGVVSLERPTLGLVGQISWQTDQTWPTTLPGTAVGTIPFN